MRNVAVLVDGAFYLKIGHRALLHRGVISDKTDIKEQASIIAENLVSRCLKHIYAGEAYGEGTDTKAYKKARELERLYRIFFYDCPPLLKKAHHPLTGRAIDHSKTETFAESDQEAHSHHSFPRHVINNAKFRICAGRALDF